MNEYPFAPLVVEYRGDILDLTHFGYLCIVDEHSRVLYSVGDPEAVVYYRSSSKPIQAIPVIQRGLDKKYGLTEEETVILAGSHVAEPFHVEALESILKKTGLKEETLIMKPTVPVAVSANEERIRQGIGPRKLFHNCSGKHLALMMLQRELGGKVEDYWKTDSLAQAEIRRTISVLAETDEIGVGVDGCGVPVFAVGMRHFAASYKNLACIDTITDPGVRAGAAAFVPRIHEYPWMMRGTGYLCSLLNYDPNIGAKGGANGAYGFGLKKQRLGVAFKLADGTEDVWPMIVAAVLKGLGCLTAATEERLDTLHPQYITNDNNTIVGRREVCFKVSI